MMNELKEAIFLVHELKNQRQRIKVEIADIEKEFRIEKERLNEVLKVKSKQLFDYLKRDYRPRVKLKMERNDFH